MITVRKMQEKDISRVSELEKENFSSPWSEQSLLETLSQTYAYYFVAEENGKVIGICGLLNICGEGEITNVSVDAHYRRRGVAASLLRNLLAEGEALGIKAFTLEVRGGNTAAVRLYERFGFKTEGIRKNFYQKPPEDAFIMWKR